MPRRSGTATPDGQRWLSRLRQAQGRVEVAQRRRDELARQALEHGVGVRGVAEVLGIDKSTVSRRYGLDLG